MIKVQVRCRRGAFELAADFASDATVIAAFGPSGAGKSTLLRVIAGLERPESGRIEVGGRALLATDVGVSVPVEDREIGYVAQDPLLFPHLSVRRNLLFGARRARREARGFDFAEVVGLLEIAGLLERGVGGLSGGEKRRVALGRALLSGPRLLLLDEPFAGLDVRLRLRIFPLLRRVFEQFKVPALLVTHSRTEVLALAQDAVVLDRGRQVRFGPARSVLDDAEVLPLEEDASIENVIDGVVLAHDDAAGLTTVALLPTQQKVQVPLARTTPGRRLLLAFPSEDVIVATSRPVGLSVRTVLESRVVGLREALGGWFVDTESGIVARVSHAAKRELGLDVGRAVFLLVKAHSIRRLE
jgi:molybdate transport system ATP-binding protein